MALIDTLNQHQTGVPICRVHVYQRKEGVSYREAAKPPRHWAGRPGRTNMGSEVPDFIVGAHPVKRSGAGWAPTHWAVLSCRVNITRQWTCSSASFQIAHPVDNSGPFLLPVTPIQPNDVIAIEMGYVKSLKSNFTDGGRTDYAKFSGDCVFFGVVQSIKDRGGNGEQDGMVYNIQAMDMLSFLANNKVRGQYLPQAVNTINRAYVIRDLLYRGAAIDYIEWKEGTGEGVNRGFRQPLMDPDNKTLKAAKFNEENCYLNIGLLEKSGREDQLSQEMGNQTGIAIMDKFPMDVIRHISLVETSPRELWADQRSGDIHWMVRRSDIRRLISPRERHLRQYFYRFPESRANILSYTMEWSTAATVTHFSITNPTAHVGGHTGASTDTYVESPVAELVNPHTGKKLRPMTRNRFVFDDTLVNNAATQLVAGALLTIWGRAIETGMVMVMGDPTLEPGEGVQIFNTGLFGRRYLGDGKNQLGEAKTDSGDYGDYRYNPEGIYRVEALTHMFAVGGVQQGYKTLFMFGPLDTDTGSPKRLIKTDADLDEVAKNCIDLAKFTAVE